MAWYELCQCQFHWVPLVPLLISWSRVASQSHQAVHRAIHDALIKVFPEDCTIRAWAKSSNNPLKWLLHQNQHTYSYQPCSIPCRQSTPNIGPRSVIDTTCKGRESMKDNTSKLCGTNCDPKSNRITGIPCLRGSPVTQFSFKKIYKFTKYAKVDQCWWSCWEVNLCDDLRNPSIPPRCFNRMKMHKHSLGGGQKCVKTNHQAIWMGYGDRDTSKRMVYNL